MTVRAVVNRDRCSSVSMCLQMAPGSFVLDAEGRSTLVPGAEHDAVELAEAAEACPMGAISVLESS